MNRKEAEYASEAGRFLEADVSVMPLIRGIQDHERALMWHREAHNHNADKRVKKAIAQKLRELDE